MSETCTNDMLSTVECSCLQCRHDRLTVELATERDRANTAIKFEYAERERAEKAEQELAETREQYGITQLAYEFSEADRERLNQEIIDLKEDNHGLGEIIIDLKQELSALKQSDETGYDRFELGRNWHKRHGKEQGVEVEGMVVEGYRDFVLWGGRLDISLPKEWIGKAVTATVRLKE